MVGRSIAVTDAAAGEATGRSSETGYAVEQDQPRRSVETELRSSTSIDPRGERDGDARPGIPSSVVHELRTPLTAIHGYAQLLRRNVPDGLIAERAVDVILRESTRLGGLLNQLHEVAELDGGRVILAPAATDVLDVVRRAAEQATRNARHHEVIVEGEELRCECDGRRLAQILGHVLNNAVAYSPEGGRIAVRVRRVAESGRISVADSGLGIPEHEAEQIYTRHFRGTSAQRAGVRGLGLGLFVAREVAELLGGRIWHEPGDTGGTVFHIVLPIAPTAPA